MCRRNAVIYFIYKSLRKKQLAGLSHLYAASRGVENAEKQSPLTPGKDLSGKEKQKIVALYQNGFDFPGKVVRPAPESTSVFSWDHAFSHFSFRAGKNIYASGGGNLICELNGDADAPETETFLLSLPRENGATIFALPETSPFWEKIGALATLEKADIFFHGPMVLDLDDRRFFRRFENVYFPLCDRF